MNTHEPLEGADQGALNETALRILNLLFILNSSSVPLSTEQIVSDVDLGYGSGNRASDLKKFRRDREKLAERGIAVKEIKPTGGRASEESLWTIDRASSFAAVGAITRDDADALMRAVDECLSRSDIPFWISQGKPGAEIGGSSASGSAVATVCAAGTTGAAPATDTAGGVSACVVCSFVGSVDATTGALLSSAFSAR